MTTIIICMAIVGLSLLYLIGWFVDCINKAQINIDKDTSNE